MAGDAYARLDQSGVAAARCSRYNAAMNTWPLLFALLSIFTASAAFGATPLRDLSSDQRVRYFQKFLDARPHESSGRREGRFIRAWLDEQRPLYRAHDAEHVLEFFDLFTRRLGAFNQAEALGWLADRLVTEFIRSPLPLTAANKRTLRVYADPALIFTAGPIPLRFTTPASARPFGARVSHSADAFAYRLWRNPVLKSFIAGVADRVPSAPRGDVARTRWFFQPYLKPGCTDEFETEHD